MGMEGHIKEKEGKEQADRRRRKGKKLSGKGEHNKPQQEIIANFQGLNLKEPEFNWSRYN